ncbi:uncharacterized protein TRIADDRAFT_52525 [Trichoplax adhaerens]|uniref:ADP-ribosylation factor-like protein 2-binding protein n=1 Tax=Trichoplax adhaerens TaxID=10228 RepID=B3RJ08_TRIAD|nr:hypothetical protein TRIADDRAFT_52525 [Trichoplax adhaerens]EDV29039.1 hypothetical protein TRIADDRAFT_52525 [Trichoplax adhaerens]|eukprot:XP_002108241.1 hypothetical protein TRIADDRAFT_52525 [Trichoplax adhaerens]
MAANRPDEVDLNFEENIVIGRSNRQDAKFDTIIGHLEDIIMDEDEFQQMESDFMEKYYMEFENTEENKLIYTDIFNEYVSTIEKYTEESLRARMPNFSMKEFMKMLHTPSFTSVCCHGAFNTASFGYSRLDVVIRAIVCF